MAAREWVGEQGDGVTSHRQEWYAHTATPTAQSQQPGSVNVQGGGHKEGNEEAKDAGKRQNGVQVADKEGA